MERGWLQVHFRGRNDGLHKNMRVVQCFGHAHFFKGLFARKYAAYTQEVQQLLEVFHLKNHWVSTDVVIFYVEFSSPKKRQLVVTHHRFYRSVGRSWMPKKQSIDPFPGI